MKNVPGIQNILVSMRGVRFCESSPETTFCVLPVCCKCIVGRSGQHYTYTTICTYVCGSLVLHAVNIYLIAPIGWYTGYYSVFLPKGVWNNVRTKWGYYFEVKIITERSEVIIFENCTNEMSAIFLFHGRVYECMKCKHPLEGSPNSVRYTNQAVWLYLL